MEDSLTLLTKASAKPVLVLAAVLVCTSVQATSSRTSGVYETGADYAAGQLSFRGICGSEAHRLELHDILNKPYIDVTHDREKRRYSKKRLFGVRACDGRDYRFVRNHEYEIVEAKELYIYSREIWVSRRRRNYPTRDYYFSVGPEGQILALTLSNLTRAVPDNPKFYESLRMAFGAGQSLAAYDDSHKMFKVNRLLLASREEQP